MGDFAPLAHKLKQQQAESDLSNLPTTLVLLAEKDELKLDGECFVRRLKEFGVPTCI